ncbi:helix-turn-helix transcriptional regulator [Candidatus Gracilibacteria bacterium]|nr:helix-turn-helix transcriptional regulator [Candidatus Gracilibacteria bacterium]NJM87280.1 helix-turn-helix transcriptional regulator [Hydrococcus sp. RU_2_2]
MPLILHYPDWYELWEESEQNGGLSSKISDFEAITQGNHPSLGKVRWQEIQLRTGLCLIIYEYLPVDEIIEISTSDACDEISLGFFMVGNVRTKLHGLTDEVYEIVGHNRIEFMPDGGKETEEYAAGKHILRVLLEIEPDRFFGSFATEQLDRLPTELQRIAIKGDKQPFYRQGTTTTEMQLALRQILNCPYQGITRQIYLEAKSMELISLQFSQFLENDSFPEPSSSLSLDDVDRVYHAKEILIKNFNNPPSLIELARLVNLNDRKLKQGFRQIFGTTVFGYLHDYRMQQAYQLLSIGRIGVKKAANSVGYNSPTSFNTAFKKKFGISPKALQRQLGKEDIEAINTRTTG